MSATIIALCTILALVVIVSATIIYRLHTRTSRRTSEKHLPTSVLSPMTPGFGVLLPSHPASHITPFGSIPVRPIFNHQPGSNMRKATRREDGTWEFNESLDSSTFPRTPESAYSADGGSPTSRSASSMWTHSLPLSSKAQEAKLHVVPVLTVPPPPAYTREDSSSIYGNSPV